MKHEEFKINNTAAGYVNGQLDETLAEEFELHMIACPQCVDDVEIWRAIKLEMPRQATELRIRVPPHRLATLSGDWRMAASLVGASLLGAVGGWLGKATTTTELDSTETVVFNVPAVSRGTNDCSDVKLAPDTQLTIVRLSGLARNLHILALNADMHILPAGQYTTWIQPDGSYLLRLNSRLLLADSVYLESQDAVGEKNPLGCLRGSIR